MGRLRSLLRAILPPLLAGGAIVPLVPRWGRISSASALGALWVAVYVRYRRAGRRRTALERELLRGVSWEAFWRHYNEQVPTIEQEFELWGPYHEHRHRMRYRLVAQEVRRALHEGGRVLDVGCGSALVADLLTDLEATYVGLDFPDPLIRYGARKYAGFGGPLRTVFVRGDAASLPLASDCVDVVVMSEVIEHLIRPELAVWEVSRVLKPGGVFVMTTNNASEAPLVSPLVNPLAWLEKMAGAYVPGLISRRPWVWPEKVDRALLPEGAPDVFLPHTHHIYAETKAMFAAAGLVTVSWLTFEFPPPQSRMARRLASMGERGRRMADAIEGMARRLPGVRRLGTHVLIVCRKTRDPVAPAPPPGVWPGPLSEGIGAGAPAG